MQRLIIACVALIVPVGSALGQVASTMTLDPPLRQVSVAESFSREKAFPVISNGRLVTFPRIVKDSEPILLLSLGDGRTQRVAFRVPEATVARIHSVAVTPAGHLVVAGNYDRAAAASVNFIATVDGAGRLLATFDLGAYTPERICAAGDGTFWTLGEQWSDEQMLGGGRRKDLRYALLRHYAADGTLRRSLLPRNLLPTDLPINLHPLGRLFGRNVMPAYLSCGEGAVGVYIGHARGPLWFEVTPKTGEARASQVEPVRNARMTGLTLVSPGVVYASFGIQHEKTFLRGLYRLVPQPDGSAAWTRVMTKGFSMLIGHDGQNLIYRQKSGDGRGSALSVSRAPEFRQP